jgi:hypothetical protein
MKLLKHGTPIVCLFVAGGVTFLEWFNGKDITSGKIVLRCILAVVLGIIVDLFFIGLGKIHKKITNGNKSKNQWGKSKIKAWAKTVFLYGVVYTGIPLSFFISFVLIFLKYVVRYDLSFLTIGLTSLFVLMVFFVLGNLGWFAWQIIENNKPLFEVLAKLTGQEIKDEKVSKAINSNESKEQKAVARIKSWAKTVFLYSLVYFGLPESALLFLCFIFLKYVVKQHGISSSTIGLSLLLGLIVVFVLGNVAWIILQILKNNQSFLDRITSKYAPVLKQTGQEVKNKKNVDGNGGVS